MVASFTAAAMRSTLCSLESQNVVELGDLVLMMLVEHSELDLVLPHDAS